MNNVSNILHATFEFKPDFEYVWEVLAEHGKIRLDVLSDEFDREYVAEQLHAAAADEGLLGLKINRDKANDCRLYVYLVRR